MSIPITTIAGYLGAGKTTLINRLLHRQADLTGLAVLVNDFGDINIDAALLRQNNDPDRIIGLSNGCVCCSLQDDFSGALEALSQLSIQHIVFEASGVANPAKLRAQCFYPGFHPSTILVVVDGQHHLRQRQDKYIGQLVQQQVSEADVLFISKTQDRSALLDCIDTKKILADEEATLQYLLSNAQLKPHFTGAQRSEVDATTDAPFTSISLTQKQPEPLDSLRHRLAALPNSVTRVKGFAMTPQGRMLVQMVGRSISIEPTDAVETDQLVVISTDVENKAVLLNSLRQWSAWQV